MLSRNGLPTSRSGVRLNELELSSGSILEKARAAFVAKLAKGEVPDPTPEPEEEEVCRYIISVTVNPNLEFSRLLNDMLGLANFATSALGVHREKRYIT